MCVKMLHVDYLKKLQKDVVVILCKLEKIFPPLVFDVMDLLIMHLPREPELGRPIKFRWMDAIKRAMVIYKMYIWDRAWPKDLLLRCI